MEDLTQAELTRIGRKISQVIAFAQQIMVAYDLTYEELRAFEAYSERLHTTLPIFDPTAYREALQDKSIDRAQARTRALYPLLALPVDPIIQAIASQPAIRELAEADQLQILFLPRAPEGS